MFNNIIRQAEKAGIMAKEYTLQSGYYFDGKDNGFVYPAIVFEMKEGTGQELSNFVDIVCRISKRYHLVKIDSGLFWDGCFMRYTTKELSENAKAAYRKSVCFLEGFWMKRHDNPKATDKELIQAGHDSLIRHGYKPEG